MTKIVVVMAVAGFALFEVGSPLVTRAQLDGVAHDAADEAARELFERSDVGEAQAVAQAVAVQRSADLKAFGVDGQGVVHVTVAKQARALLLDEWSPTQGWYDVAVAATSAPKGR